MTSVVVVSLLPSVVVVASATVVVATVVVAVVVVVVVVVVTVTHTGKQFVDAELCGRYGSKSKFVLDFYRATLCVSAVFSVARCLSVRLSI